MTEPKGLISFIDGKCYEYYKDGMDVKSIARVVDVNELIVRDAIRKGKMKDKILNKENEKMDQLIKQVEKWSIDKGLDKGNSDRQALKFYEEAGEIGAALSRNRMDDLKDGIGDTIVTLIILAQQHGMTIEECLQYAYDEIKGRKGKTINGTFIKESDLS